MYCSVECDSGFRMQNHTLGGGGGGRGGNIFF